MTIDTVRMMVDEISPVAAVIDAIAAERQTTRTVIMREALRAFIKWHRPEQYKSIPDTPTRPRIGRPPKVAK